MVSFCSVNSVIWFFRLLKFGIWEYRFVSLMLKCCVSVVLVSSLKLVLLVSCVLVLMSLFMVMLVCVMMNVMWIS